MKITITGLGITRASLWLALAMLALPFADFRCNDQSLGNVKGYELVTGKQIQVAQAGDDMALDKESMHLKTHWLFVFSFLIVAILAVYVWLPSRSILPVAAGLLVALFLGWLGWKSLVAGVNEKTQGNIKTLAEPGLWAYGILLAVAFIGSIFWAFTPKKKTMENGE